MIELELDSKDLDRLMERLEKAPEVFSAARREAFRTAGPKLKAALDGAIGGTGKVRGWQGEYLGSKGGYAAVRPKKETWTAVNGRGKRYAVGYVTNAVNSGHRFPSPSGRPGYRPRIRSGRQSVPGRKFYQSAGSAVPAIARETAQAVAAALIKHLEG